MGVDFRTAPLAVREQFSLTAHQVAEFLPLAASQGFGELMVLSTCNRTEFYAAGVEPGEAQAMLVNALKLWRPAARPAYRECARFQQQGEQAVCCLFRVTAGLESQILGDTHVQTQVRQAMEAARRAGTLGRNLDAATSCALRAAKRIRRRTGISAGSASVGAAVLRSIRKWKRGRLSVLLVGGGQAARDIAAHLAKTCGYDMQFAARREPVCQEMAETYHGAVVDWAGLDAAALNADVVVTAISGQLSLLSAAPVAELMKQRPKPLLIVDAGVPRNADPAAAAIANVTLLDIDTLEREQFEALAEREARLPAAEAILEQELERWRRLVSWRQVEPAVRSLYQTAERLRLDVVNRCGGHADVDRATGRLVKRMLAGPVQRLRDAIFLAPGHQAALAVDTLRQLTLLLSNEGDERA